MKLMMVGHRAPDLQKRQFRVVQPHSIDYGETCEHLLRTHDSQTLLYEEYLTYILRVGRVLRKHCN